MKHIIAVLGMARSGTSAIASGLDALGVPFGDQLAPAKSLWNPKGFWEDTDIVYNVNRSVMYAIDYTWSEVNWQQAFSEQNNHLNRIKDYAVGILKSRFTGTDYFGFKDPRTAKIVPFWKSVFDQMSEVDEPLTDHYVIVLRNPLSSAYSYQRVTGCDLETGILLWLVMHLIPAICDTNGKHRLVVSYESMMKDPKTQLNRMKQFFNFPLAQDEARLTSYTSQFLDKSLQHFDFTRADLETHSAVTVAPLCKDVFDLLTRLANDTLSFDDVAFHTQWQQLMDCYRQVEPMYAYMDEVGKQNRTLEKRLRSIRRSIPWKLTYPIRFVDEYFRQWRRKIRENKKLMRSYGK